MKIVAFGDSLTVGENAFPFSDESGATYPKFLHRLAENYIRNNQSGLEVEILNRGLNGDLTSGMVERFSTDVAQESPDYVVILGGTNDIGWGLDNLTIIHNLTNMYDVSLKMHIGPVACAVPSILGLDWLIPPRLDLNRKIQTEAATRKIPFLDLFGLTADPMNNRLLEEYSADGLHLNSKGYKRVGEYVFNEWLKMLLRSRLSLEKTRKARSQKLEN
jgi:lysophospholipase L1-like esterase